MSEGEESIKVPPSSPSQKQKIIRISTSKTLSFEIILILSFLVAIVLLIMTAWNTTFLFETNDGTQSAVGATAIAFSSLILVLLTIAVALYYSQPKQLDLRDVSEIRSVSVL